MFKELRRLDEWTAPNPLENVREFKISESEMAYLTIEEIRILLVECENSRSKDLTTIVKICQATGARWSEAEGLKGDQIRAGQIIYLKTKGKKNRAVPITENYRQNCHRAEKRSCSLNLAIHPLESHATRWHRDTRWAAYARLTTHLRVSFHNERG